MQIGIEYRESFSALKFLTILNPRNRGSTSVSAILSILRLLPEKVKNKLYVLNSLINYYHLFYRFISTYEMYKIDFRSLQEIFK